MTAENKKGDWLSRMAVGVAIFFWIWIFQLVPEKSGEPHAKVGLYALSLALPLVATALFLAPVPRKCLTSRMLISALALMSFYSINQLVRHIVAL